MTDEPTGPFTVTGEPIEDVASADRQPAIMLKWEVEPEPPRRRWTLNRVLAVAALVALAVILAVLEWGWTP